MIIRTARTSDIPELSALAKKTYAETFGHSMTKAELESELNATRSDTYFTSVIGDDTILVAVTSTETIAGYIQLCDMKLAVEDLQTTPEDQAINALYVHADYQGKGIGKQLMDAAFDHPRLNNAANIYIDVWDENERALNFYKTYGFIVVGKCPVIIDGKEVGHDLVLRYTARKV